MSLWVDKHRPTTLNKLGYNHEQSELIKCLVKSHDFPHMLFCGPSGAGKKTRIQCMLKEIYGSGAEKLRTEMQLIETPSRKKIEVKTICSNHHIELNPSDCGIYDRVVIQEIIKLHASSQSLNSETNPVKVVVITEADRLTKEAQQGLRRTMEKYINSCRLILSAEVSSRIIPAIKSRTLLIRCSAPTVDEIANILTSVAAKEQATITNVLAKEIARQSNRNLRRALMMAEAMHLNGSKSIILPHWLTFIKMMARKVKDKSTNHGIEEIRNDLYQLLAHMVPPDMILKHLVYELITMCPEQEVKADLISYAATYDGRLRQSSKSIIQLEAFVAKAMLRLNGGE